MTLEAKLDIDGRQYDVINCEFELMRPEEGGLPVRYPFRFTISNDSDLTFIRWLSDGSLKNGSVIISMIKDTGRSIKTVMFENASCVSVHEHWTEHEFTVCIILSAGILKLGPRSEPTANQ